MKTLSIIDANLENKVIEAISLGNELEDNKRFSEAIENYDKAFNMLPEPKFEWEMISAWLVGSYFNACFSKGDYLKAKEWAYLELKYRSSEIDVTPFINIGMVSFEMNEFDEAYRNFEMVYRYGEKRPFQEYNKKYLTFYLNRKTL